MSAGVVDQLLELLRAGKDVVYVDPSALRRKETHGLVVARREPGEHHSASKSRLRTIRGVGGSIEISETTGGLRGAMVDVVLFRSRPTPHERSVAATAVSVRRGNVLEVA